MEPVAQISTEEQIVPSPASAPIIPLQQHERFYSLPDVERERVLRLKRACEQIAETPGSVVVAIRCIAPTIGMSFSNLKTLYYAYRATSDWTVFARSFKGPSKLPEAFTQELKRRMLGNPRSMKRAIQTLRDDFAAGKPIPGYGTWREWYQNEFPDRDLPATLTVFPDGWKDRNLYNHAPSKAQRALKTGGWIKAKRHLPHVMRDMSQLRFLELIVIDDFETDIMVQARNPATGRFEIVVCKGLLAIDGATRRPLAWALKPKFRKSEKDAEETGSKTHSITQSDVKELIYGVISGHGLPTDYGVTILCENAAAAISTDFEMMLESLFGIQVARTGLMAKEVKTLRNGFAQDGGKPFEKGWIEATFNIAWNYAAALPGQKGATYQLRPADLTAKLLYAMKLLDAEGLTPEQQAQIKIDFLTAEEAVTAFDFIFNALANRKKHRCQGFAEVVEYVLPDGSETVTREQLAQLALPQEKLELVKCEPRLESPMERWAKITAGVTFFKVPEHALMLLLLTPKKVTLKAHKITFDALGTGFTFFDADSPVQALPEGTELLGYFDGAACSTLHCTDLQGRYLGQLKRRGPVDIRDKAKISELAGAVTHLITKHVHNPVRELCAAEDEQLAQRDAHNRAVFAQAGVEYPIKAKLPAPADRERQQPAAGPAKAKPEGLSAKLGRHAPARDAFTAHREALARGVAREGAAAQAREDRALRLKEEGGKITAEEIQAATSEAPAAPQQEFSAEEITRLLSDS